MLSEKIGLIKEDLRTSWYFRIWGITWAISALVVFIILIVLGAHSTKLNNEEGWRTWFQKENKIVFPAFNLRLAQDEGNVQIVSVTCNFIAPDNKIAKVETNHCLGDHNKAAPPAGTCWTVNANVFEATIGEHNTSIIDCTATTNTPQGTDTVLGYQIQNDAEFGVAWTWIVPNQNTWMLLTKTQIQHAHSSTTKWGRQLVYHTTNAIPQTYRIVTKMNDFHVVHLVEENPYPRLMSVADIGGFAFFMYLLHTGFMLIVGIFVANDSKFLGNERAASYSNL
jgi:hypothetical protein